MYSTCTVNNSCTWTQLKNTDKPHMCIPVTNPCMQYKHHGRTPQEHNSIYTHGHVVKINSFSVFIIHIALSLYLLNEMQTMAWYSWAWDHIDASAHTHTHRHTNTHTHTHSTLHKYTRGWADITAVVLIKSCVYPLFDCMEREKKHTGGKKRNETSLARLLQTHCPEYKFPMQVFVSIHQYSLCERMYRRSGAIDPVLNLIVIFLFSGEPGEGETEGDQMSWWQHAALSKVALSIKIDRERETREIFQRDTNRLTF